MDVPVGPRFAVSAVTRYRLGWAQNSQSPSPAAPDFRGTLKRSCDRLPDRVEPVSADAWGAAAFVERRHRFPIPINTQRPPPPCRSERFVRRRRAVFGRAPFGVCVGERVLDGRVLAGCGGPPGGRRRVRRRADCRPGASCRGRGRDDLSRWRQPRYGVQSLVAARRSGPLVTLPERKPHLSCPATTRRVIWKPSSCFTECASRLRFHGRRCARGGSCHRSPQPGAGAIGPLSIGGMDCGGHDDGGAGWPRCARWIRCHGDGRRDEGDRRHAGFHEAQASGDRR